MTDEQKADIENLRTEYNAVCQKDRAVTDFRGKLLAALPLASGAGIYLLLPKGDLDGLAPAYLIAIGLFGFLVTLGLFLHEIRGIDECGDLIEVGRALEEKMGLLDGQFIRAGKYYHDPKGFKRLKNNFKGPLGAAWVIYPSVCIAWLFVAFGVHQVHAPHSAASSPSANAARDGPVIPRR
jgi:hypothetical protein